MRVVVSAYTCDPQRGSEAMNGWRTVECLAQLGYEAVVLTHPEKAKGIGAPGG